MRRLGVGSDLICWHTSHHKLVIDISEIVSRTCYHFDGVLKKIAQNLCHFTWLCEALSQSVLSGSFSAWFAYGRYRYKVHARLILVQKVVALHMRLEPSSFVVYLTHITIVVGGLIGRVLETQHILLCTDRVHGRQVFQVHVHGICEVPFKTVIRGNQRVGFDNFVG
jgi:hypothetical protein